MSARKLTTKRINEIIKKALNSDFKQFKDLIKEIKDIHQQERDKGLIDNKTTINHGLIRIKDFSDFDNIIVVGDLHGDLESLEYILKQDNNSRFIFLGDYGDRGEKSVEVLFSIMKLKASYPKKILLLRGNHEFPPDLSVSPFDMPKYLKKKYGKNWNEGYKILIELYDSLYHAAIFDGKYVFLHGGIPPEANSIDDIALAREKHPDKRLLEDIIWSDPRDIIGTSTSIRGAGRIFGKDVTKRFLEITNSKLLIRGHEACNGLKKFHDGLGITVFSRKGSPYHNSKAGYLRLNGSSNAQKIIQNSETF